MGLLAPALADAPYSQVLLLLLLLQAFHQVFDQISGQVFEKLSFV